MTPLTRDFYDRDPRLVARELLGMLIIRESGQGRTTGRIVETEAYLARRDPGSHSYQKQTRKNASMFGPPGHAYVYAIHARWCFNVVTEPEQIASAVLIRAIEPLEGISLMRSRRNRDRILDLARGPARLCEAMAIDRAHDGLDLTRSSSLYLAADEHSFVPPPRILRSPRIGLSRGTRLLLRFSLANSPFVSGPSPTRKQR